MGGAKAIRVVSLVPSATETLRAWGTDPVAGTRFCEQPDLPSVGGTKNPDIDAIVGLAPDLVVMDEEENRRPDHEALVDAGLEVLALAIRSVGDLDDQLPGLAGIVGATWRPLDLGDPPPAAARAVVPIWRRPWMTLGRPTYGASLIAHLGIDVVPVDGGPYPQIEIEAMRELRPDVVLVPSEPYAFRDGHLGELATVAPPVRVDGQDLFWWGARTRAALARLRDVGGFRRVRSGW
jgi:ABC-type Fe3+-hydroxamate transport system substrate-binding protein